ncbi:hypothetical protein AAMO2058_001639600, partial [Amorphochlora amoebiformis]
VPTFEEWVRAVVKGGKVPLVELKPGPNGPYIGLAQKVWETCKEIAKDNCIFQSFTKSYLYEIRALDSKAKIHTLYHVPQVLPDLVGENKRLGSLSINVMVYTVDRPGRMLRLISNGVDGIITNRPKVLRDVILHPEKYTEDNDYMWIAIGIGLVSVLAAACISRWYPTYLQSVKSWFSRSTGKKGVYYSSLS